MADRMQRYAGLVAGIALAGIVVAGGSATAQQKPPLIREKLSVDPKYVVEMDRVEIAPAGKRALTTSGLPGHRHPGSTYVYVVDGAVLSRLGDGAERRYGAGESWSEQPGQAHYIINASAIEPAHLLVVFIAATADADQLTRPLAPPVR